MIQHWLDQNNLPYTWLVDQKVFQIDQDKFCVIKEKEDRILDDTFDLILDEEEGELIQEHDCKYLVFQLGEWIFYTLPDKIKLTPLKYLGQSKQAENFPYIGIHGMYEICNGSKNYKEWCKKAKFLGIKTLGICEYNTLAGTLQFQLDCLANEIKPILGITALVKDEKNYTYRIKVYARNEIGWRNILYINKAINVDNEGFIWEKDVFQYLVGTVTVLEQQLEGQVIFNYKNVTGQKTYFKLDPVQWKSDERDKKHLEYIKWVYENIPDKAILVCDSYYLDKQDSRTKTLLNKIGKVNIDNQSDDQYFKSKGEIEQQLITLFNDENRGKQFVQQAFDNLSAFDEVDFRIQTGKFWLPEYKLTEVELMLHQTKDQLFWDLIDQGIYKKIVSKGLDPEPYLLRVEEEYVVLEEGGFIDYFLILSDIVRWCDMKGILIGVGRGSVGGSIVAFLLGLTKTDAIKYDLLFERFLNKGRIGRGLPDADTDVESNRRDEVKRYIEERYGIDNVCSIGTYGTFKTKAALRDLCRISGVPPQTLNYFAAMMEESDNNYESVFKQAVQTKIFKDFIQENYDAVNDIPLILGQPKTVSIHAAGVIITPDSREGVPMTIYNWMPVKKVDGIIVSEWEGPQLETAGFLKEDILGIKQLDKFQDIFKLIKSNNKELPSLDDIDTQDAQVYELFCQGFNQDLFHFGSVGQTQYSQQVKPREIQELIAMIAAYRPGAMEFGAHEDYVKIKMGRKQPEYDYMLKEVTEKTFGLYLYQEQVMKACQVLGGFDLTTADDIRSAMGKKKYDKIIKYKDLFIKGACERGCGREEAEKIWSKLEAFAGYGFNASHATSYALTGYFCQYLKVHFPIEFWTVALQYASEEEIPGRINEISRLQNIKILSPDINKSQMVFSSNMQENSIYWSIGSIRNVGEVALQVIMKEREQNGPFFSLEEFVSRIDRRKVNKTCIVNLILSGCFDQIENISLIQQRKKLLRWFFVLIKQPLPEIYDSKQSQKDWFWFLEQKRVSGSGLYDYTKIFDEFGEVDLEHYYCTPDKILLEENVDCKAASVGILNDIIPKKSKKGEFAQLIIENNNALAEVTLWNESWIQYKDLLNQSIGRIIAVDGNIVADRWKKHNIIHSQANTKVEII